MNGLHLLVLVTFFWVVWMIVKPRDNGQWDDGIEDWERRDR